MIPSEDARRYEAIVFGGRRSPGVVSITNHKRAFAWSRQQPAGTTGATTKYQGVEGADFTATFSLSGTTGDGEPDDFAAWDAFSRHLYSTMAGVVPKALPVYHPDLASLQIARASVLSIGGLTHDGLGGATVAVQFIEYRPAKKKAARKAKAVSQGASTIEKPDPNAAAKAELEQLLARARTPNA